MSSLLACLSASLLSLPQPCSHSAVGSDASCKVEKQPLASFSGESGSLGRFSKSTGRLANGYDVTDGHERTSMAQTLPRKMHNGSSSHHHSTRHQQSSSSNTTTTTTTTTSSSSSTTRRLANGHHRQSPPPPPPAKFGGAGQQYGSMINISFRNQVTSPAKTTTHYVQTSLGASQPPPLPPQKPERTYKSTLSRSKSFNVEIADDGVVTTPRSNGYGPSNGRASTQMINRLDETPPLKSPGILASISRSNRDLIRNGRSEY